MSIDEQPFRRHGIAGAMPSSGENCTDVESAYGRFLHSAHGCFALEMTARIWQRAPAPQPRSNKEIER